MKNLINIYLSSLKNTFFALKRSWIIIPSSAILLFVSTIILNLLMQIGPSGMFSIGGFLAGMFSIFVLNIFYNWLNIATSYSKLTFKDIINIDSSLFSPLLNVAFILFIINLLANSIFATNKNLIIILNFVMSFLFNPIPECIMTKSSYGTETLAKSFMFIKSYYIEWFLPYIIFLFPLIILNYQTVLLLFGFNEIFIPGMTFYKGSTILLSLIRLNNYYIGMIISFIIALFFSIFRIYLFNALDGRVRR